MLEEVHIDSFRSCVNAHIQDIGGMLVLLGRNGTGKTNLLRAIEWAAKSATSVQPLEIPPSKQRRLSFKISLESRIFEYRIAIGLVAGQANGEPAIIENFEESVRIQETDGGTWIQLVSRKNEHVEIGSGANVLIGHTTPCIPALASILPAADPANTALSPLRRFLAGVRYYPLDEANDKANSAFDFGSIVPMSEYKTWVRGLNAGGDVDDSVIMRILHMNLERPAQFDELRALLGSEGLGLIDQIDIKPHVFE